MEKQLRRRAGLTFLFWRYLLTTGAIILLLTVLWWIGLTTMMRSGIVFPANTAADEVSTVIHSLESGEMDTTEIPYYYRWAIFSDDGQTLDEGNMDNSQLEYAKSALEGNSAPQGIFYSQYHRIANLANGMACVIQYDYSMPYGSEVLQERLPEFQTCATIVLLLAWLTTGAVCTHHFAGILRRDAALLTNATKTIGQQRLDTPLTGKARVKEFGETLAAMEQLRVSLAQSLERQWALEQQRKMEIAALTHDLKTPLTVISGNAELLQEEALDAEHKVIVDAILRSAIRLQSYVAQLRSMADAEIISKQEKEKISLIELVNGWKSVGQSLCVSQQIHFSCSAIPATDLWVYRASLDRAVSNLLDNAVRYTPADGNIVLTISLSEKYLTVTVEDTGTGFSAEALVKGEQAFYTSNAGRSQDGHMGLGLYLAEQAARMHGGTLRLSNTESGARVELSVLLA